MSYTPGILHVDVRELVGSAATGHVRVIPNVPVIRDLDGVTLIEGTWTEDLVAGECSVEVPPTDGGVDPVTGLSYTVAIELDAGPLEPIRAITVGAGATVEVAGWASIATPAITLNAQRAAEVARAAAEQAAQAAIQASLDAAQSVLDAAAAALAAAQSQAAAGTAANTATTQAGIATTKAAEALASANAAAASAAAAATSAAATGTGSPEGVVTASPGKRYIDTNATLGASEWRKATGVGNTGWRVIDGDTGWLDLTTLLLNGWTGGTLKMRRVGNFVEVEATGLVGTGASSGTFLAITAGFRPDSGLTNVNYLITNSSSTVSNTIQRSATAMQMMGTLTSLTAVRFVARWACSPTWPTVFPV